MSLSMYQASAPVFERQLGALSAVLRKGEHHAAVQGADPMEITSARLAADMLPLTSQVQIATDGAKGCMYRLAGLAVPALADTERTFAELQDRIATTLDLIRAVPRERVDGSEQREIALTLGSSELRLPGQEYLLHLVLPNFFFHVTTAYALLRHQGVPLGKRDFLGS